MKHRTLRISVLVIVVFLMSSSVLAGDLSVFHTLTLKLDGDKVTGIHTTQVNFVLNDGYTVMVTTDAHPALGVDADFGFAFSPSGYPLKVFLKGGVVSGLYNSDVPLTPYFQVTIGF